MDIYTSIACGAYVAYEAVSIVYSRLMSSAHSSYAPHPRDPEPEGRRQKWR